jgi:uncharacterized protein (DUF2126 family)
MRHSRIERSSSGSPPRMDLFEVDPAPDPLPAISRAPETAPVLIRPSLCVQAREGRLHVFLPYAPQLADYLDLVSAVEDTCIYLKMPVWVEGYAPPPIRDCARSASLPTPACWKSICRPSNWDELEQVNTVLDEEARGNRLTAEKFAYDGSHHSYRRRQPHRNRRSDCAGQPLSAPSRSAAQHGGLLAESSLAVVPVFRNVCRPTSQYPRVDEARLDALYELEVAFNNLPSTDCPPSLSMACFATCSSMSPVTRIAPSFASTSSFPREGHGLQLGLLELRAFEMAPHVRMNLLQMLLVRALVSMFWKTPFDGSLIRWGTALHDRFMLPDFVKRDLFEVLAQLRRSGFDFDEQWFAAHLEFRFPKIGSIAAEGVELELATRSSPGTCSRKKPSPAATVRTWIHRWSASR